MEFNKVLEKLLENGFKEERVHTKGDAFLQLINGIEFVDLSNLCSRLQERLRIDYGYENVTIEECYMLTQNLNALEEYKNLIVELAYECIEGGKHLGNRVNAQGFNTSSWISHSLYVAKVCEVFASPLGANSDVAWTMGIMHDYGRRDDFRPIHVELGAINLAKLGWLEEASGCATHNDMFGDVGYNNEPDLEGYYIDDNGDPKWEDGYGNNPKTLFAKEYPYSIYHVLIWIADIMSPDFAIIPVWDRLNDIAQRRPAVDAQIKRGAYLAVVTNLYTWLHECINKSRNSNVEDLFKWINNEQNIYPKVKASKGVSLEEIKVKLIDISGKVFDDFKELSTRQKGITKTKNNN